MNHMNGKRARAEFERAVQLDPGFAPAYAGLAVAYAWETWVNTVPVVTPTMMNFKAKAAAEKALRLDNSPAEAHCALAMVLENIFDWPTATAEHELRAAIALNPSYAYAHGQYGIMLAQLGRLDEASAQNLRAAQLDPFSPEVYQFWSVTLACQGKYEAAMEQVRKHRILIRTRLTGSSAG